MKSSNWKQCQRRQLDDHNRGNVVFSNGSSYSEKVLADNLNMLIPNGTCLDVGCGILPQPAYMRLADKVTFSGIDPFEGESKMFDFKIGFAESLPYEDNSFDAVLFATSLDHIESPLTALMEAKRVAIKYIVVWGSFYEDYDEQFKAWQECGGMINNHVWAFSLTTLKNISKGFKIIRVIQLEKVKNKIIILCKEQS